MEPVLFSLPQAFSGSASDDRWRQALEEGSIGWALVNATQCVLETNAAMARVLCFSIPGARASLPRWIALVLVFGAEALADCLERSSAGVLPIRAPGERVFVVQVSPIHDNTRSVLIQLVDSDAVVDRALEAAFEQHRRSMAIRARPIAVTLLDLDRFRQVNDTLGHGTGDRLLSVVAKRLCGSVLESDIVIRLGGDEFVILHPNGLDHDGAAALGHRLVDRIGRPFLIDGQQINTDASVGIATSEAGVDDGEEMLRRADLAMCEAKSRGRRTFYFFEPGLAERAQQRRDFEIALRRALVLKQFVLLYQPQAELADSTITGFEALMRWSHPQQGQLLPESFIPLAEEIGEIHGIGAWAIRTACLEAASWENDLKIAVNVSSLQFLKGDLVDIVEKSLAVSGLSPHRLELEITESVLLDETALVIDTLLTLRDMGVGIAMDDFGTGYSSLNYLSSFLFSKIKLDQSFLQKRDSPEADALVRSILSLGANLGMTTLAEGIESESQYQLLAERGCAGAQGFLISHPMPADEISRYEKRTV